MVKLHNILCHPEIIFLRAPLHQILATPLFTTNYYILHSTAKYR